VKQTGSNQLPRAILAQARELKAMMVRIRRDIHRYPEPGLAEHRTAALVARTLGKSGIQVHEGVAGTGVVGILKGSRKGPVTALRADMDALSIQEETGASYRSRNPGFMHACGHDGHVAILLGTAELLARHRDQLPGTVVFLFQPAEEGPGGALPMIEAGVLDHHRIDRIIGLHLNNSLAAGHFNLEPGPVSAAADEFRLEILGSGGHGAHPEETIDAIVLAAQVICALQTLVSRRVDPFAPAVLSIGTIEGGFRQNIIADRVVMTGTVRTMESGLRERFPAMIRSLVAGVVAGHGGRFKLHYEMGYPVLMNDPKLTSWVRGKIVELLGPEALDDRPMSSMGAEDFAYFSSARPGVFLRLGSRGRSARLAYPHHHARFDFDEECMVNGAALFSWLCLSATTR